MTERLALRMSVGPVQAWINAGRRTRDLWAGSILLSWLSGHLMAAVEEAGGSITVPVLAQDDRSEPTFAAIRAARARTRDVDPAIVYGPLTGTLVNHFRAEIPAAFDPNIAAAGARMKFVRLGEAVWDRFFKAPAERHGWPATVKQRWDAQTNGRFFEFLWVSGPLDGGWAAEARWLEQRKTMRTHAPPVDPAERGDPCPIHPEFRELGGFTRGFEREQQDRFWTQVRTAIATAVYGERSGKFINTLEIRESERLSALALVKRLFPLLGVEELTNTLGWVPDHLWATPSIDNADPEWRAQAAERALRNWPSTAFVAAIPWIVALGSGHAAAAASYAWEQYAILLGDKLADAWRAETPQRHRVKGIDELPGAGRVPLFAVLDGTLHFQRGLDKKRFEAADAHQLSRNYETLLKAVKPAPPPQPFYAMLEMDGDLMGTVFSSSLALAQRASAALLAFAAGVPEIVRRHDGILIYAGADDVNAFLPTPTAIACAAEVREHWNTTMGCISAPGKPPPTISASILFCDYQNALGEMRRITHARLDSIAKAGMGRNALALAVAKSGGVVSEWASRWPDGSAAGSPHCIEAFAAAAAQERTIASRLAYVMRQRFSEVLHDERLDDAFIAQLLAKELGDSGLAELGATPQEKAAKVVGLLRPWGSAANGLPQPAPRHIGGLLIARFLTQSASWSYHQLWAAREGRAA